MEIKKKRELEQHKGLEKNVTKAETKWKEKSSENCWLSPTVPRSVLRSVGRLNFLPGPFTETKE